MANTDSRTPLWHMLDAEYLPADIPACDILAGYLVSPGLEHPWVPDDWARAKAHCPGLLPIFTSVPGGDATAGAHYGSEAVNQCRNLSIAEGAAVVLDVEHSGAESVVRLGQAAAWVGVVANGGYVPVIYGSESDRALLEPLGKLWLAHWGNPPELIAGTVATQYDGGPGKPFDQSVVSMGLHVSGMPIPNGGNPVAGESPTVGFAPTHTGEGYWEITEDGHIYTFGDAPYLHSPDDPHFAHVPIKALHGHPRDYGYWVQGIDGSVYAYGAAKYHGTFTHGTLHEGPK